jgi:hypothetical protein
MCVLSRCVHVNLVQTQSPLIKNDYLLSCWSEKERERERERLVTKVDSLCTRYNNLHCFFFLSQVRKFTIELGLMDFAAQLRVAQKKVESKD